MYRLERLNVVKFVADAESKDLLLSKGFIEIVEESDQVVAKKDYSSMRKSDLIALAKDKGLDVSSSMHKQEIIDILERVNNE